MVGVVAAVCLSVCLSDGSPLQEKREGGKRQVSSVGSAQRPAAAGFRRKGEGEGAERPERKVPIDVSGEGGEEGEERGGNIEEEEKRREKPDTNVKHPNQQRFLYTWSKL